MLQVLGLLLVASVGSACDLCAVSGPVEAKRGQDDEGATGGSQSGPALATVAPPPAHRPGAGWSFGLIGEDIDSSEARDSGRDASAEQEQGLYHQQLTSRMLELMVLYRIDSRLGIRAYVPYYDRTYQTFAVSATSGVSGVLSGEVRGVGDTTVEATDLVVRAIDGPHLLLGTVLVGMSLPTGESSELVQEEEIAEGLNPGGHVHTGSGVQTLVHPHDLALGSGSWDGLAGVSLYARSGPWFASGRVIGRERNRGRAGYRYGDSLTWAGGPGYQLTCGSGMVALQAYLTGEVAAPDHVLGQVVSNSGDTTLFLGPELSGTWDGHLAAETGIDLPLVERTDGQQLMPRYRLHAGIDWSF